LAGESISTLTRPLLGYEDVGSRDGDDRFRRWRALAAFRPGKAAKRMGWSWQMCCVSWADPQVLFRTTDVSPR